MQVEIKNLEDIPDNHEYYSTLSGESFMLKKTEDFIIFQFPSLAKLHIKYPDKIFCDGTFYFAPSISYQVFITRIYAEEMNYFFTTSFTIMKNKEQINYEEFIDELKKNILNQSLKKLFFPEKSTVISKLPYLMLSKNFFLI